MWHAAEPRLESELSHKIIKGAGATLMSRCADPEPPHQCSNAQAFLQICTLFTDI
ncbi:hypothetical protein SAMN02927914_06315 [Mesorhizobium qingshengii]|uniref:Uncharacterized protein n=1 Tax=Mesorhizobium qingshengii TaxID=1165689 RepID=A0A1G5ZVM5_9HYPH|nr:hypothetical protein SAMN02927914_06315 [Mesorhizobium qingshengii]